MSSQHNISSSNLNSMIQLIFHEIPVSEVIENRIRYNAISQDTVSRLMKRDKEYFYSLTDTEDDLMVRGVGEYLSNRMEYPGQGAELLNVFDMLRVLCQQILLEENDVVTCDYRQIREWRRLVEKIGEEIPVTMKYAFQDMIPPGKIRKEFSWDYVIHQNNNSLNRMMERGISEHHFHLWGSAPYSQVSWLNLMNRTTDNQYTKYLLELERQKLPGRAQSEYDSIKKDSLLVMHLQAALIRVYLCSRLGEPKQCALEIKKDRQDAFHMTEDEVRKLLCNPRQLYVYSPQLESVIEVLQCTPNGEYADYAMRYCSLGTGKEQEERRILSGERWFIYANIRDMYSRYSRQLTDYERNLFFAYLLIQTKIRSMLVQITDRVGFDYFQQIQNRKGFFLGDDRSTRLIARMAIRNPLTRNDYFRELEARISPADTAEGNRQRILELEQSVLIPQDADLQERLLLSDTEELLKNPLTQRYYYVFHFHKKEDPQRHWLEKTSLNEINVFSTEYRHHAYRKRIEKQTMGIIEFRNQYPLLAQRVRGIDACAKEVGCRPENFASVFRMLHHHSCTADGVQPYQLPKLGMTFHVAEEFIDPVDGLRAIDEAIHFLNMESGDRLGHALALGEDVRDWCREKHYQISITRQDYLDNLAWLHHAIRHYGISGQDAFLRYIEKEFEQQFNYVYYSNMDEQFNEEIMSMAQEYYEQNHLSNPYRKRPLNFTIEQYYHAWTLRGDHPELYVRGFFEEDLLGDQWGYYKVNREFPHREEFRYTPECSLLYYHYHYNNAVKKSGYVVEEKEITNLYIEGVCAVQKAFQKEIAARNLAVEVNPTSNVKIGAFRSYQKHPITALYNNHLVHTREELHDCPQLQISINTDDSGVFFTSLENEYAMMACALEEMKDEKGNPCYNFVEIKEWLDAIREMGNEQGFRP